MSETNTRPTPRQLADRFENPAVRQAVERYYTDLISNGYVIVHPDDVPEEVENPRGSDLVWNAGWNACRKRVFGSAA